MTNPVGFSFLFYFGFCFLVQKFKYFSIKKKNEVLCFKKKYIFNWSLVRRLFFFFLIIFILFLFILFNERRHVAIDRAPKSDWSFQSESKPPKVARPGRSLDAVVTSWRRQQQRQPRWQRDTSSSGSEASSGQRTASSELRAANFELRAEIWPNTKKKRK